MTGSLETGLIVLSLLTGVGVISGLLYPSRREEAKEGVIAPTEAEAKPRPPRR